MDYDKSDIASIYDEARTMTPEGLRQWLDLLTAQPDRNTISPIIDLGCGTGSNHWRRVLESRSSRSTHRKRCSIGLASNGRRASVVLVRASAQMLPFPDHSGDVVFMSMVYLHFFDPVVVATECRRVLRDGGHGCIRNSAREADLPHWHFFPAVRPLIELELPAWNDISCVFTAGGFTPAAHEIVRQVAAASCAAFVHKSSLRVDPFLARLSDEYFSAGWPGCMLTVIVPTRTMLSRRKLIGLCSPSTFDNSSTG
jgi:ubiquinone/menaquinone biosynthesis C-methylase UbiE